ncbi:cardiolipin synthase [Deinococcus humi]|uniref:Cardiolipin synthase n=1 Tax=Deinococcus humi TaxID=662880 RepID=A0A7W8JZ60_9DEIO|nr:cardiolipin synthase [Deinococcus humi]GGO33436.1 hypothetical protein GCM10008949_32590 [Deinococcus humi]
MLTGGSQNLHSSSFGPLGLGAYTLATSDAGAINEYRRMFAFEWARARTIQAPWRLPADLTWSMKAASPRASPSLCHR